MTRQTFSSPSPQGQDHNANLESSPRSVNTRLGQTDQIANTIEMIESRTDTLSADLKFQQNKNALVSSDYKDTLQAKNVLTALRVIEELCRKIDMLLQRKYIDRNPIRTVMGFFRSKLARQDLLGHPETFQNTLFHVFDALNYPWKKLGVDPYLTHLAAGEYTKI